MATAQQFKAFLADIEPSTTTKGLSSSAQKSLRDYLRQHPEFKDVHLFTFLTGSYLRDSAIRPRLVNGKLQKPDIDIIVVTNHTEKDKPASVHQLLEDVLAEEYELCDDPHTRSVGIKTSAVEMDVVAIIAPAQYWQAPYSEGMNLEDLIKYRLFLPDKALAQWCETNPPKQIKWSNEVNKASGGMFKPLVKLVKWWRRETPTVDKRPKGFVLECMVAECMDLRETSHELAFIKVLDGIVQHYAIPFTLDQVPYICDPGVPTNSVTSAMTFDQFAPFYKKLKAYAELAHQAHDETEPEKQLKLWRQIFGDRFPAPGVAAKSLEAAFAPGGLTFPDKPITPRKPTGFA